VSGTGAEQLLDLDVHSPRARKSNHWEVESPFDREAGDPEEERENGRNRNTMNWDLLMNDA
jgi:hypothetical protein